MQDCVSITTVEILYNSNTAGIPSVVDYICLPLASANHFLRPLTKKMVNILKYLAIFRDTEINIPIKPNTTHPPPKKITKNNLSALDMY